MAKTDKVEKEYICPYCSTKYRTVRFKKQINVDKVTSQPINNYILCPICGNGVKQ